MSRSHAADLPTTEKSSALDVGVSFESVRLKIDFDSALFDSVADSVKQDQLATACKIWRESFMRESGPWGFGIASDVACRIKKPNEVGEQKQLRNFDNWLLRVEKGLVEGHDVIQTSICRLKSIRSNSGSGEEKQEEKCEAQKIIPWTEFRVRLLRHRAFVRLLSASLIEQLPFLSVVTKSIIHFDKLAVRGYPEVDTVEVTYPSPPANLFFVEAHYDPYENRYRMKEVSLKEAVYRAMNNMSPAWIVNRSGRGERAAEFTLRLQEAFTALTTQFQLDLLKFERDRIQGDVEKLKVKSSVDVTTNGKFWAGIPAMSMSSAFGGLAELGFKAGAGFGASLGLSYAQSKYAISTDVQEKDNSNTTTTARVNLREMACWLEPQLYRSLTPSTVSSSYYQLGARLGLMLSEGDFKTQAALPVEHFAIKAREVFFGLGLGFEVPFGKSFLLNPNASLDLGIAEKSTQYRAGSEFIWIFSRLPTQPGGGRPPRLKFGTGFHFNSLVRRFMNSESARTIETYATLNGLQASLFLEKNF